MTQDPGRTKSEQKLEDMGKTRVKTPRGQGGAESCPGRGMPVLQGPRVQSRAGTLSRRPCKAMRAAGSSMDPSEVDNCPFPDLDSLVLSLVYAWSSKFVCWKSGLQWTSVERWWGL